MIILVALLPLARSCRSPNETLGERDEALHTLHLLLFISPSSANGSNETLWESNSGWLQNISFFLFGSLTVCSLGHNGGAAN